MSIFPIKTALNETTLVSIPSPIIWGLVQVAFDE